MAVTSPRASVKARPTVPEEFFGQVEAFQDEAQQRSIWSLIEWLRQIVSAVNALLLGKDNSTGTVTLTASATSTTLNDIRIGRNTLVIVVPTTANALADIPYQTYPNAADGAAVLNHANTADVDKTFAYSLRG